MGAEQPAFADSAWEAVSVPHTWNGTDGQNGGDYYRGVGWYRRTLALPAEGAGRRVFLQFDGASLVSDVFVNGRYAGRHEGAFATFRLDVTTLLTAGTDAVVAVRVDNSLQRDVAPLSGDFTLFGGLIRDVHLLVVDEVHVDALDFGGPGVSVRQRRADAERAEIDVTTRITNDRATAENVTLRTTVLDADGKVVAEAVRHELVAAGHTKPVSESLALPRPRLWSGRADPYLYAVRTDVRGEHGSDTVSVPLGVRTMAVDPDVGFLLNGQPYPLYGVNTHPTSRPGRGPAVTRAEMEADFGRILELGATALRLAHYQHPPHAYDLADRHGLVLWTEAPYVSEVSDSPEFQANVLRQTRELIRQNVNHPSLAMWGLGNEQYTSNAAANRVLAALQALAKEEDPDRLTTYAHCCKADDDPLANHADLTGYNRYFHWYGSPPTDGLAAWADGLHATAPGRRFSVSEYGGGASILHHRQDSGFSTPASGFHSEEWQSTIHEQSWEALRKRPFVWGAFVWVMFDFPSDGRDEGDRPGINDKGLVTTDGAVAKDAFYFLKSRWSREPVVHITSRRDTPRLKAETDVKVYSNAPKVELSLNGASQGEKPVVEGVARWAGLTLRPGTNGVEAVGSVEGSRVSDRVTWDLDETRGATSVRVDVGSSVARQGSDGEWSADRNVTLGRAGEVKAQLAGGSDPEVCRTYREGSFAYRFPLENGRYRVALLFVEPSATRAGERIFNVNAQRERVIRDLDLFREVGRLTPCERAFAVDVKEGMLDLELVSVVGEAVLSAIVVTRAE
jgi:beta-galactosidase